MTKPPRESKALRQMRQDDIARYEQALQHDPNNASFHALLADKYLTDGRTDQAIHEWRTAIGLSPENAQAQQWKSKLRRALEVQTGHNAYDFTVCYQCQADMPTNAKQCSRCGAILKMGFIRWATRSENLKSVARPTLVATLITLVLLTIFSSLSLEWKVCIVCSSSIVFAYYLLRGMGG